MAGPHNGICLMKYAIWVYVAKYYWTLLNIVILFIIQARVLKYFRTIESIDSGPFPMFFSNIFLTHFWRKFLGFKGTFYVHRKAYPLWYWNRSTSVCQSVSLSVRQSVSPSVRQSVSPSVRQFIYQNLQSFSEPSPGSGLVQIQPQNIQTCL